MKTFTLRHALAVSLAILSPVVLQAQPAKSAASVAMIDPDEALASLKKLIDAPAPAGLSEKDRAEYVSHTAWIQSAYDRVKAPRDVSTGQSSGKRQHGVPARDIVKLQSTFDLESRKFQTLSNASKVRHDIAMNAIRNMK